MSVKGRGDRDGDGILWYLALLDEREHWGICLLGASLIAWPVSVASLDIITSRAEQLRVP